MNKYGVRITQGPSVIKDVDAKQGIVISYPSTFDVTDSGRERVKRGAFNRTINAWGPNGKKRTKVLFNHEPWSIIGRPLVLREDDYGLYAESQIVRTRTGTDVLMLIENEVITEQSIGYDLVRWEKSESDDETEVLDILEVKLYEYSFLAWGMNMETPIMGVKSGQAADRLGEDMRRVERVLKGGEFNSDDVPEMLSRVLTQWREELKTVSDQREKVVTCDIDNADSIRDAIKQLQSLLPPDSPAGTLEAAGSTESGTDSGAPHSESLKALLQRVKETNERQDAEMAAFHMLREFQTRLWGEPNG